MKYLLSCPKCGHKTPVETGQAGQTVHCACGQELEVPSVRGLRELEMVAEEPVATTSWSMRQGLVFLGSTIAVLAILGGVLVAILRPSASQSFSLPIDKEAISREITALSPADSFQRFESVAFSVPGYSEELAGGRVQPHLWPCVPLLAAFEGKGPQPLAPAATTDLAKQASVRGAEVLAQLQKRDSMNDSLWLIAVAGGIGVLLAGVAALIPTKDSRRRVARPAAKAETAAGARTGDRR